MKKAYILLCLIFIFFLGGCQAPKENNKVANLSLIDDEEYKTCPYEELNNEYIYYVTTLKNYLFTIDKSKKVDKFTLDDEFIDLDSRLMTEYGDFEYVDDYNYKISFFKRGEYDINFSIDNQKYSLKIVCDDESNKYDEYRISIKDEINWINDLNIDLISEISVETGYYGIAPGSLIFIKYTNNKEDISNIINELKNDKIMKCDTYSAIAGGGYKLIKFYSDSNSYELRISNGYIFYNNEQYLYKNSIGIDNETKTTEKFVVYIDLFAVKNISDDSDNTTIDYLKNIEFELLDEKPNDLGDAVYYIDKGLSDKLSIYSKDVFEYSGHFFKIISDINFESCFN